MFDWSHVTDADGGNPGSFAATPGGVETFKPFHLAHVSTWLYPSFQPMMLPLKDDCGLTAATM
jgi:hypothetical protein